MGWDYVDYGARHVHLHDMQIWSLRHFLADAARHLALGSRDVLFAVAIEFFASCAWHGPGVVTGTDLGQFIRGNRQARPRATAGAMDCSGVLKIVVAPNYFVAHERPPKKRKRWLASKWLRSNNVSCSRSDSGKLNGGITSRSYREALK
jgi:hypothetical protein